MAEPKTRPTDASVDAFLDAVVDDHRRADARVVDAMMRTATGEPPVMWGRSIVGYGSMAYGGSQGKQRTWPVVSFAVRKTELVLYLNTQIETAAFEELGPHRRGVGCLYLKRLADIDQAALDNMIRRSVALSAQ